MAFRTLLCALPALFAVCVLSQSEEQDSHCALQVGSESPKHHTASFAQVGQHQAHQAKHEAKHQAHHQATGQHKRAPGKGSWKSLHHEATGEAKEGKEGKEGGKGKGHWAAKKAGMAGHDSKAGGKHLFAKARSNASVDFVPDMITKFLEMPAPWKNEAVSENRPLVFMHQHRAGGTTLRKLLYNETEKLKMKAHILCSGGVSCRAFKNNVSDAAVYGGEFCWREMMTSLSGKHVSCVTNFREPVARITSCYMQRLVAKKKVAPFCMAKLDTKKLKTLLVNYGCVNEPFRRLGQCGVQTHADATDRKARMQIWNNTLQNLASCVPILVDKQETVTAAVKHFPQFKQAFWHMKKEKLNGNSYPKDCEIPDTHLAVIKELAAQETLLYEAAKKRALRLQQHA